MSYHGFGAVKSVDEVVKTVGDAESYTKAALDYSKKYCSNAISTYASVLNELSAYMAKTYVDKGYDASGALKIAAPSKSDSVDSLVKAKIATGDHICETQVAAIGVSTSSSGSVASSSSKPTKSVQDAGTDAVKGDGMLPLLAIAGIAAFVLFS
jgi:hypothetical protein